MLRKGNTRLHQSLNKNILNSLLPIKKNDKKLWFDVHLPKAPLEEEKLLQKQGISKQIQDRGMKLLHNTKWTMVIIVLFSIFQTVHQEK